ncbi:IS110 family transposase [Alkalimarinus coralli]|uniref:IS110 family transposase n=1 Tax=Alkalimarinus coralli TaxID=2935863 RepID=UPI00202B0263|nr:IS110 family transposase [Alkalimarinus coralli]
MKFYTKQHKFHCGIDLHTKMMFVCILDQKANILIHKNIPTDAQTFLDLIQPYREDLVVGVECIFSWYWIADVCHQQGIKFILGHALYMKCIHGGKTKNDKIDSEKIARIMLGKNFPMAYVYPPEARPIRDLMRRRCYLVHLKGEVQAHISITNYQYNLPPFEKQISKKGNRLHIIERFKDPAVRMNVETDIGTMDILQEKIVAIERFIVKHAKQYDPRAFYRLQTVPGIGLVLALTILYEIQDIHRFPTVQDFCSYSRLVKCAKESAGKNYGYSGGKIGNAHLKWAFSEAAVLLIRESPQAKKFIEKNSRKHGKGKAISMLAHKLGRAVYFILKRNDAFDIKYFFNA